MRALFLRLDTVCKKEILKLSKKIILKILISSLRILGVGFLLIVLTTALYHAQYTYVDPFVAELRQGPEFNSQQSMENAAWLVERISYILPVIFLAAAQTVPYIWVMKKDAATAHLEKAIEAFIITLFIFVYLMPSIAAESKAALEGTPEANRLNDTIMWFGMQIVPCLLWIIYHIVRFQYLKHPKRSLCDAEPSAEDEPDCDELDEHFENKCSKKVLKYLEFNKSKKDDNEEDIESKRKSKK